MRRKKNLLLDLIRCFTKTRSKVEEIDDIDGTSSDPFVPAAVANERELNLSEEQKGNYRKIKEEDDVNIDRKLQVHLKRRRHQKRSKHAYFTCVTLIASGCQ